jgi:hypothetical protein
MIRPAPSASDLPSSASAAPDLTAFDERAACPAARRRQYADSLRKSLPPRPITRCCGAAEFLCGDCFVGMIRPVSRWNGATDAVRDLVGQAPDRRPLCGSQPPVPCEIRPPVPDRPRALARTAAAGGAVGPRRRKGVGAAGRPVFACACVAAVPVRAMGVGRVCDPVGTGAQRSPHPDSPVRPDPWRNRGPSGGVRAFCALASARPALDGAAFVFTSVRPSAPFASRTLTRGGCIPRERERISE